MKNSRTRTILFTLLVSASLSAQYFISHTEANNDLLPSISETTSQVEEQAAKILPSTAIIQSIFKQLKKAF